MEDFGTKYKQYIGNTEGAIEFLLKKKCGTAVCALFNQDIGYVDLWYGNEKAGLKKIAEKHGDVLDNLQDVFRKMHICEQSDNRIILEGFEHRAIVSKKLGQKKTDNWLLSVYKKNSVPASSSDIETGSSEKGNGTAAPQNANPTQI